MNKTVELTLTPEEAFSETTLQETLQKRLKLSGRDWFIRPVKRSIDARGRKVKVNLVVEVVEAPYHQPAFYKDYSLVSNAPEVIIAGSGPAGLFAALRLIELGLRPVLIERGKDVQARRRDLAAINKDHIVNPESNYCFGEGGAGTYSDGKLYTRSKKRGDVRRILETLVAHGAPGEILFDTHPHIGTNKLPRLVADLRERIKSAGGQIHFNTRVVDFILRDHEVKGVVLMDGSKVTAAAVILATGHSARDMFQILHGRNIQIETKPFALGLRVEHEQNLIDRIQYHCSDRGEFLPPSSYSLVHQAKVNGRMRGVFSFCMCPGGFIVPSATAPGEVVVNGMSPSRRDSKFANSGIVVAVEASDFKGYQQHGALAGLFFQSEIEKLACKVAGGTQAAPAQRLIDFMESRVSSSLLDTSYQPGLTAVELSEVMPGFVSESLKQGLRSFGRKKKGYMTNDAQLVGVETRTSSPVRIPRDPETLEHPHVPRLFPCGEGAGYAGGIVSAAMDGERCAEAVAWKYFGKER